jgi:predicted Na+-dependent transporter
LAGGLPVAAAKKLNLIQTISAVLWSFFGVRRGKDHDQDMAQLNPVHVVITGVIAAIVFVLLLVVLVNWILS